MKLVYGIWALAILGSTLLYAPIDIEKIPSLIAHKENLIPVAIIGGGPSGIAASINPARSGFQTVIFQGPKPGGELRDAQLIENWPGFGKMSGAEAMDKFEAQAREFGVQIVPLVVDDLNITSWPYKLTLNNGTSVHALTVIIATGSTQRMLGIEGETTYWGKGLFSCGLCDGSYSRGKNAVVIGGGDIAIQRALQLLPEALQITIMVPGSRMSAHETMQEKIKKQPSITIKYNKEVKEIVGNDKGVTHIMVYDTQTHETSAFPTCCVFLSTGLTPNTELIQGKIPIAKDGCISLQECARNQHTIIEGIMAAGTVSDAQYRQISAIVGDGTKAGMDALNLLSKWGFDSTLRPLLSSEHTYRPPTIPHPLIKHIASLEEFKKVLNKTKPILVEFYSPSCPSCRKMEGPLTTATEEFKHMLDVYKIDKDQLYSLIEQYDINLIPAFLLMKNGKEVARLEGSDSNLTLLLEKIKKGLGASQAPQKR